MPTKIEPPPLAQYLSVGDYKPIYGDLVIWSGWFSQWIGFVTDYREKQQVVRIVFAGVPRLLLTIAPTEYDQNSSDISLAKIRNSWPGTWAIQRHDRQMNTTYWYI